MPNLKSLATFKAKFKPSCGERQRAVSDDAIDHLAIGAGLSDPMYYILSVSIVWFYDTFESNSDISIWLLGQGSVIQCTTY